MPAAENNYLLDGADNTEAFFKTYNVSPSVDAVQEFRIQIGQYSAEYGAGGGAVVNVVTKSGTNQFHGAAWEFVRNNIFDARNFFLRPNQDISPLHQNQFGVAAGGPIIRNKTFVFGDFDLTRISQGQFTSGNVPTTGPARGRSVRLYTKSSAIRSQASRLQVTSFRQTASARSRRLWRNTIRIRTERTPPRISATFSRYRAIPITT